MISVNKYNLVPFIPSMPMPSMKRFGNSFQNLLLFHISEFHGLDMNVLMKALKSLESKGKCELIEFDDNQGVKFF